MHNETTNKTPEQIIADGDFIAELFEEQARTPFYCTGCTWNGLGAQLDEGCCPNCGDQDVRRYLGLDRDLEPAVDYLYAPADESEEALLGRVAARAAELAPDLAPGLVHTGGGIYCVKLDAPRGLTAFWGVADTTWGYDLEGAEGDYLVSGNIDVRSTEPDADVVARAIVEHTRTLKA